MRFPAAVLLCVFLLPLSLQAQAPSLAVDESQTRAWLSDRSIELDLPVVQSGAAADATLHVELIDPDDKVLSRADRPVRLPSGRSIQRVSIPAPWAPDGDAMRWARVRYSVSTEQKTLSGIVALGAIQPELFRLRVAYPEKARLGRPYRLRILASNPVTKVGKGGVQISATMKFDADDPEKPQIIHATTGRNGEATLTFNVPHDPKSEPEIEVKAVSGRQEQTESINVSFDMPFQVITSTDKELYQPGQEFHARALCLGPERKAFPKQSLRFTLEDPEENVLLRDTVQTNEYGIASVDWHLPESARLGDYNLQVEYAEDSSDSDFPISTSLVKISRYDLPNFSVTAVPDHPYYLPGQDASVKIGAQYLFGKPLLHGSMKVVREEERRWNYTTQKWDVDESDEVRGELDEKGNYDLKIKLAPPFEEFADQNYERFRDLSYAAYITDKTTGKTEQRRFTIRMSHDRVHMYVTREEFAGGVASFYIATYFPDGTPAPCNVQLSELTQEKDPPPTGRLLRMFSTNKYGVAKVSNLNLASRGDHSLKFVLIDPNGAWTTHTEDLWFGGYARESENILVDTDHAIYKSGDAIYATIRTARDAGTLVMDVTQDGTVLRTISIHPHEGRASVTIPFDPDFKGELTLAVYNLPEAGTYRWDMPFGAHTVIFPEDRTLDVNARLSKASYRPGEDADVAIRVLDRNGNPAQSAFGVVVFDEAVEERVHTDQDFGGNSRYGFWSWGWWYNPESYGGVSRQYLESYDAEKGVPKDLDTVAEVLLNSTTQYALPQITGNDYTSTIRNVFQDALNKSLQPLAKWLYSSTPFPRNDAQLKKLAAENGVALESVLDPWGQPYHYTFEIAYGEFSVVPTSAGPDKKFGTADDISWNDFRQSIFYPYVDKLRSALFQAQSQHALHLGDETSLERTLAAAGMDFDRITDPWGHPYKIAIAVTGPSYTVSVTSLGPKADTNPVEIRAWSEDIHYFTDDRAKIDDALAQARRAGIPFPRTEKEFSQILKAAGVERGSLRDPWNSPYQVKFSQSAQYSDAVSINGGTIGGKQTTTPVTLHLWNISILSNGSDRKPDTPDDILVERFMSFVDEQTGKQAEPVKVDGVELNPYSGAIRGVVTDPTGAVVAGATIIAKRLDEDTKFETTTDVNGKFLLKNLPSGIYRVTVTAAGFTAWNRDAIPVRSASATDIAAMLSVGGSGTTVEVTVEASLAATTTSQTLSSLPATSGGSTKLSNYTPRLREFFPETLLWQPSVVTHRDGTSKLHFKLADNITTWKLSLLASDKDGRVGYLQKELQAFQPFFVEHDPPKILTAGDELQLPVVVRNYLEKPQTVSVTMKPESWFTLLGDDSQELSVPAGDSSNAVFRFRATAFIRAGKQRVTAANHALGDAIEKPVTVHPNGREDATFATRIVSSDDAFDYDLPAGIIPSSLHAQLKLYPNLVAHAVDAIEAGLERPYGCGEQTISSTYPSLMVLEYLSKHPGTDPVIAARAHRYLEQGYRRLLNYRSTDGGFTYWGSGEPDSALTAYAIRFLRDAAQFIKVDDDLVPDAELWLIRAQTQDGWQAQYGRSENLTSYVALTLSGAPATDKNQKSAKTAVGKAISHLGAVAEQYEDPYEIATVGLLSLRVGDSPAAERSATILRKKALTEGQTSYWELVENTPFYGWGHAGAVETTALVVRFLREMNSPNDRDLIQRGLLYMLASKDRYGVWYSGQTTQQVLRTMMEFLDTGDNGGSYQLEINGKPAADVTVSSNQVAPSFVDISKYLDSGKNHIVVHRNSKGSSASLQVASDYYTPWTAQTTNESVRTGAVRGLKLKVEFDTHDARVGEDIHCKVHAERFGSRGRGMMLAEIGLPPGVDIDRASLDKAMGNFGINQYDVLPDRLVLYLWPQAGGTQFEFTFRPRIAMKAMNAQSVLYDYYNPEEQVVVAPERFSVRVELGKAVAAVR